MLEDTLVEEDIHPVYESAGATDIGRYRKSNQDAYAEVPGAGLWVIADGMGGYRDGDVASRKVCEALLDLPPRGSLEEGIGQIRRRMADVNQQLYEAATRAVNPIVSGSTVAMLLVRRTACAVLWAGDSRVYRWRHGHLRQLTSDHAWVSDQHHGPGLLAEHTITRAVGGEAGLMLDVRRDRVRLGDRYLLCSDGLTRELKDEQIAAMMGSGELHQCARALIAAALAAGGRDNVTVVVVEAQ